MHPIIDQLFTDHIGLAVRPYAHMSRVAGPGTSIRWGCRSAPHYLELYRSGTAVGACLPACLPASLQGGW